MMRHAFCNGSWVPSSSEFIFSLGCLSKNEQEIAMRYAYQRDVGKLLIRGVGARTFNVLSSSIHIDKDLYGRPFYRDFCNELDFNISHGGDFTVFAATPIGRCGVDVMRLELPSKGEKVDCFVKKLKSVFTPLELKSILSGDDNDESQQLRQFYRHWSLKESFVKALGCGLRVSLQSVECHFPEFSKPYIKSELVNNYESQLFSFEEHSLPGSHIVALTQYGYSNQNLEDQTVPFTLLNFDQLIDQMQIMCPASPEIWNSFINKPKLPPSPRRI